MKNIMLFLMALVLSCHVMAQQTTVSGTVTDAADGSPIIGANILVKGTTVGVISDINGNFSVNVPGGSNALVVSCIGYRTQEITLSAGQRTVSVVMSEDSELLDEVVVVGYGTMKKSDLSGASVSVGEDKIKGSIITNFDQALQGHAAGVTSVMTSGAPGSSSAIRVRGQATINADAEPLYVIDGVIFQGGGTSGHSLGLGDALGNGVNTSISPLSTLNPADIVSMEILKDASATAIYGSQGANGVVLITTKRGKAGEAKISYEGMFAVQEQKVRLDMMNLKEFATFNNSIAATTGGTDGRPEYFDPSLLSSGTNWQDAIFQVAPMHQHNLSIQGGTDKVQYYVSGSYLDQEGTIIDTWFERFSVRTNLDAQVKPWLKLGMNAMFSRTKERLSRAEGSEGVLTYSLQTPPDIAIYDAYGNYSSETREGYTRANSIALSEMNENLLERQKLSGSFFMDVTPIKNLIWHSEFGYDVSDSRAEIWRPTYYFSATTKNDKNEISIQRNNNYYWAVKNFLTYSGNIAKHNYSAMLGQELWESSWENMRLRGSNLPNNDVRNPDLADEVLTSSGFGSAAMSSFFGRATYNYDDRYLGTYTYRRDGSSNFGPKNRWANFHSFAASWRFSNENFFIPLNHIISNGKLRLGWGQTGNANISGFRWGASISTMPSDLGIGYRQSNIANPYIQWETQEQWNLGLDLSFLRDRINLVVDMYDKTSKDMLMPLQLPTYMGTRGNASSALSAPYGNYGTINNKGVEISINTRNLTGNFQWDTDFQISFNKNKLVALDGTDAAAIEGYGQWNDVVSRTEIGQSLYGFYGYIVEGVYTSEAEIRSHLYGQIDKDYEFDRYTGVFVGDTKYKDLNGDGKIDSNDKTNIGSPLPKFTFGLTNTFRYKSFDLSIFVHGSYGNKIYNYIGNQLSNMDYWSNQLKKASNFARIAPIDPTISYEGGRTITTESGKTYVVNNWFEDITNVKVENPNTNIPRGSRGTPYRNNELSSRDVENGSYLRIKNITLGYTFPRRILQKAGIEQLRIYTNVQNLHTFTKYSGYDPEVGFNPQDSSGFTFGVDNGRYPSPRIISFGLNLTL